jgi:hypothetical protein
MMKFVALALMVSAASAACPNACSGHGTCTVNDVCECYQDWQSGDEAGGDCSDRTCPFDIAWADVPSAEDVAHGYAECSGAGLCNRKSGLCECFDGFTGKACRRTTCPNDCSGHGTCEYLADMNPALYDGTEAASEYDFGNTLSHNLLGDLWDQKKTRMCVCDPKWTDVDCSRRMCPKGNDVLERSNEDDSACDDDFTADANQIQTVCLYEASGGPSGDFAIVYSDLFGNAYSTQTITLSSTTLAADIETALKQLPDHALEDVTVASLASGQSAACVALDSAMSSGADADFVAFTVEFTAAQVSGDQPLLDLRTDACSDGCQPLRAGAGSASYVVGETTPADGNAYECGRRGK